MIRFARSVTLLELLIAIVLFATIAVGFYSIDLFSRNQLISSQRHAEIQNEVSFVLAHITKEVTHAIGSTVLAGQYPFNVLPIGGDSDVLRVYVDLAADGVSAGDGKWGTGGDRWRAYRLRGASAPADERYQLWYYPNYIDPSSAYEVLAKHINFFGATIQYNFISVGVAGCYDPTGGIGGCGTTVQNPEVGMTGRVHMPSVSLN